MSALRIHLFGGVDLYRADRPLPPFPTQKSRALFAFLVLNRARLHSRLVLVGVFWGERPEAVARKCLRTDLWRVRSVLEEEALLRVQGSDVGFDGGDEHWVDVEEFERRVAAAAGETSPERARLLTEAVALYRGDLLEGIYDDWCLYDRERLRLLYLSALERLLHYHQAREEWEAAIGAGTRLLHADPLREHVHREVMRCHVRLGNRPAALRQYAACERLLRDELEVEPMDETRALHEEIRGAGAGGRPPLPARGAPTLLERIDATLSSMYSTTRELERARTLLLQTARGG